ncbi:hypothetical protein OAF13_02455 [Akkermansiaceae bacterium]|nr:hypothetical protein [Akkermansiaceae bacterium]
MVIYALIFWMVDCWEKGPFPLMLAAFLWGSIPAIFFALIAQEVLYIPFAAMEGGLEYWPDIADLRR